MKTPSQKSKDTGYKLVDVSRATGVSCQTLSNWSKNKPLLFKVVIAGVAALDKKYFY